MEGVEGRGLKTHIIRTLGSHGVRTCCMRAGRRTMGGTLRLVPGNDDVGVNNTASMGRYNLCSTISGNSCRFCSQSGMGAPRRGRRVTQGTFDSSCFLNDIGTVDRSKIFVGVSKGTGHITTCTCKPGRILLVINVGGIMGSRRSTLRHTQGRTTPVGTRQFNVSAPYSGGKDYFSYGDPRYVYYRVLAAQFDEIGKQFRVILISRGLNFWRREQIFL